MKKPGMILFDYGCTLLYEPDYSSLRGTEAVMQYAVKNPRGLTPQEVNGFAARLWEAVIGPVREAGFDLHNWAFQRLLYESLQIEFSLFPAEVERVFWENATPGAKTEHIEELLAYLEGCGIRTGVVSNISFSGHALKERIDRLLPMNRFEFIVASSEYMVRKPNPLIFQLALSKAGLPAGEVWYCGDDGQKDILGAHGAGIFPCWYCGPLPEGDCAAPPEKEPMCEHLRIGDWRELIAALKKLP